jgi:hypothetical protein
MPKRRTVLLGLGGAVATAGCSGAAPDAEDEQLEQTNGSTASSEQESSETDADSGTNGTTGETEQDESDSTAPESAQASTGPEKAVEQWLTAIDEGETETANELMHSESAGYPIQEQQDVPTISVIEERPLGEGLKELYGEDSDPDTLAEEWKQEVEADNYASVLVRFSESSNEIYYPTTKHDGEWKVWGV